MLEQIIVPQSTIKIMSVFPTIFDRKKEEYLELNNIYSSGYRNEKEEKIFQLSQSLFTKNQLFKFHGPVKFQIVKKSKKTIFGIISKLWLIQYKSFDIRKIFYLEQLLKKGCTLNENESGRINIPINILWSDFIYKEFLKEYKFNLNNVNITTTSYNCFNDLTDRKFNYLFSTKINFLQGTIFEKTFEFLLGLYSTRHIILITTNGFAKIDYFTYEGGFKGSFYNNNYKKVYNGIKWNSISRQDVLYLEESADILIEKIFKEDVFFGPSLEDGDYHIDYGKSPEPYLVNYLKADGDFTVKYTDDIGFYLFDCYQPRRDPRRWVPIGIDRKKIRTKLLREYLYERDYEKALALQPRNDFQLHEQIYFSFAKIKTDRYLDKTQKKLYLRRMRKKFGIIYS
jgi:hypothetical protein